jgi:hypothetical protein
MKSPAMSCLIGSLAVLSVAGGAFAQTEGSVTVGKPAAGVKLAQDQCQALWTKANPTNAPKISSGQAQPFITDIKAVNANSDGSIDQAEFKAACDKGLIKSASSGGGSASSGSGAGTSGSGAAGSGTAGEGAQ